MSALDIALALLTFLLVCLGAVCLLLALDRWRPDPFAHLDELDEDLFDPPPRGTPSDGSPRRE